ncbi:hypothetical protein M975_3948 [Buttiauxella brennerae ATCC 51605]|uniref:Uncharacterized protein n=1 Tax=Buttiauxella brennerae ATCC 51605 TaxID=1354251 RepID=A0A1B7IFT8_9ENTR|nr:hypothetical protein M975_3948 [Buttiauxella brennerae ATCC 51605]
MAFTEVWLINQADSFRYLARKKKKNRREYKNTNQVSSSGD